MHFTPVAFFFASAVTFFFFALLQRQWNCRLRSPFTGGAEREKKSTTPDCQTLWQSKRSVFNVTVSRKPRSFTGLTQQERKDNIAEQGCKAFFPFPPPHAPHPVNLNLSSAERGGGGLTAGHTMNGLCKIWVLWQSMRPYSSSTQRVVGVQCVWGTGRSF